MSEKSTTIRIVAAATTFLAISSASVNASLTFLLIPRFLELPTPLNVRGWRNMFGITKWAVAGPMVFSGVGYYYLAYKLRHIPSMLRLYAVAGTLCVSIVPYTRYAVLGTIHKLFKKLEAMKDMPATEEVEEEGETTYSLIYKWGVFNLGRAIPVMAAGITGLYAFHF